MEWLKQVDETADWLKHFGIWAILISLLLNIIISLLGVVPSLFLSGVNAVVFGLIFGFFISLTGEVIGAGLSFWLYRWGFKKITINNIMWKRLKRFDSANRFQKNVLMLAARITPLIPSGVITFTAAASNMVFLDFIVMTLIGKSPSIAMETLIGHDIILLNDMPRLIISVLLAGLLFLLVRVKKADN